MNISQYLKLIWRRRWLIALAGLIVSGSSLGVSLRQAPIYVATTKIFVEPRTGSKGIVGDSVFSRDLIGSFAQVLNSRPLAEKVIKKTNAGISGSDLVAQTKTRVLPDTRVIELKVNDDSATWAARYANELATTFLSDLELSGAESGIGATHLEPALIPSTPASPLPERNALIGAALGLFSGVGVVLLLEQLDSKFRTKEQVQLAFSPLPVLAAIPNTRTAKGRDLFVSSHPDSPDSEAIRKLRTSIHFLSVDKPLRRVLVTSPGPGDGKTTISANLAASMAAAGSRVLLIQADLRMSERPADEEPVPGLSNVLCGRLEFSQAIRETRMMNLFVLPSGVLPPNPAELLGSSRMAKLLKEADSAFDLVVLDTPPAGPVTDAAVLAPLTDGVILVVKAGRTAVKSALDAASGLEQNGVRILGIVANGINPQDEPAHYEYARLRHSKQPLDSVLSDEFIAAAQASADPPVKVKKASGS